MRKGHRISTKKILKDRKKLGAIVVLVFAVAFGVWVAVESGLSRNSFRARVTKVYNGSALDGCDGFKLENDRDVTYFCFWTGNDFHGRVIGDIREGDLVEVTNAEKTGKGSYALYAEDSYVKKVE